MTSKAEYQPDRGPYTYWDNLTSDNIKAIDSMLLKFPDQYTSKTIEGKPGGDYKRMTFIRSRTSNQFFSSMFVKEKFDGTYKVCLDHEAATRLGDSLGTPSRSTDSDEGW